MEPSFFILKEPKPGSPQDKAHGTRASKQEESNFGAAPRCPACGEFIGLLQWVPPFRVELETWGKAYGDVMQTGDALLVSERFKKVYIEAVLTGLLGFEPVEVIMVSRHRKMVGEIPRYYVADVVRSETTIDVDASGKEWKGGEVPCAVCFHRKGGTFLRQKRVVIKPETWSGHDIFYARGQASIVASKRMKEICELTGSRMPFGFPQVSMRSISIRRKQN